ncbi:hypothetical protein KP509_15G062800 [Ceratopteris richardii]|nr:hypothetical protein KP509_15G062800 [Ceratopteris richardii]
MHGGSKPGIDKSRLGIIAWNARDSWEKWVRRPFSGKLSHTPKRSSCTMDDMQVSFNIKARSVSSTPLAKSPDRSIENVVNNPDMYGTYSSKHSSVAFAASCPASMRSSPHHSGVLAVINKTAPPSYLTDLHTAIQGAIAHCKQSQSNNLS